MAVQQKKEALIAQITQLLLESTLRKYWVTVMSKIPEGEKGSPRETN